MSQIDNRTDRRFQFKKRGQFFIRTHDETLSVVAMCVCAETIPLPKCRMIRHNRVSSS